jgi:hypothetical protein
MNPRKAMISVLQLFAGFSFFGGAVFFYSLPFLPKVRLKISDALLVNPSVCHPLATTLMIASFVLIGGFYFLSRGWYLSIVMGKNIISVDPQTIHKTLEECLNDQFSGQITLSDLSLCRSGKLEVEVTVVSGETFTEERFSVLQKQLAALLDKKFGYSKPFVCVVKSLLSLKAEHLEKEMLKK